MQQTGTDTGKVNFTLILNPLSLEDFLDPRANSFPTDFTHYLDYWSSYYLLRQATEHLRIGVTNESVAEILTTAREQKRSAVDDDLQLRVFERHNHFAWVLGLNLCDS